MTQQSAGMTPDRLARIQRMVTPELTAAAAGLGPLVHGRRVRASVGVVGGAVLTVPSFGLIALVSAVAPDDLGVFAGFMSVVGRTLCFVGTVGLIVMIMFAVRGTRVVLLHERGLVVKRRGRPLALAYGQVGRIGPRYGRFGANRNRVLGYELIARNGKTIDVTRTRREDDGFLTTLTGAVRASGGEVVGL
ncbi:MAG TPA: hypothetical protein VGN37_18460 [Actinocatenispora sp.]